MAERFGVERHAPQTASVDLTGRQSATSGHSALARGSSTIRPPRARLQVRVGTGPKALYPLLAAEHATAVVDHRQDRGDVIERLDLTKSRGARYWVSSTMR